MSNAVKYIVIAAVIAIVATAGYMGWKAWEKKKAEDEDKEGDKEVKLFYENHESLGE